MAKVVHDPENQPTGAVMVVGGGPAGLESARVAALRGHDVTLYEIGRRLGGSAILASSLPHKGEIAKLTKYLERQVSALGVKIVLGVEVTPQLVEKIKPDVVIIATGASPLTPEIPGIRIITRTTSGRIRTS